MAKYKAMTHIQLADCAGVSRRTLYKWLHPYKDKLRKLGVQPNAKVIPPKAVRFICETFTIDIDKCLFLYHITLALHLSIGVPNER